MCLPTIEGFCKDCFYLAQCPTVVEDKSIEYIILDQICQMTDLFTPDNGYCHHFKDKDW